MGLSGGVDSSVAAYTLQKEGYDVIGVTMHVWGDVSENVAVKDAKKVADHLGIPHYVIDFTKEFKQNVVDYFINEYLNGRTPNPCNMCNRFVKWEALLERAKEFGAEYVATGHYARIKRLDNGRLVVMNSATAVKDQTYALNQLRQDQLMHTLMPIGQYTKDEIREIAERIQLPVAHKQDSQDICFIPDGDYAAFIKKETGEEPTINEISIRCGVSSEELVYAFEACSGCESVDAEYENGSPRINKGISYEEETVDRILGE